MATTINDELPKTVAEAALFYAKQYGWRVFPLYNMASPGVCSCKNGAECKPTMQGKHPRISIPTGEGASHPATTDEKQIKAWWAKWPRANIGLWLEGSGLAILDIDKNDKKDGFEDLREILAFEGQDGLPPTLVCDTPSGGKHYYFKDQEGLPNKANALGPGLDIWRQKHYVILPPSDHVKGIYRWADQHAVEPAEFPEWLKPKRGGSAPAAVAGVDSPRTRGRPPKERIDPSDPEDIARLTHALKHVDSTNRDLWVSVAFALARAFEWTDAGFDIYDVWSRTAHNYDEKKTREQYFIQSKVVPSNPITCSSIFEWAKGHAAYKAWAPIDDRPYEIRERDDNQLDTLGQIADIIQDFPIYQRSSKLVEIVPINQDGGHEDGEGNWYPQGSYILREVAPDQLSARILPAKVRWMRKMAKGWKACAVSRDLCAAFLNIGNWPSAHKLRAFVQHPTLRDDGTLLSKRGYDQRSGLFLTDEIPVVVDPKADKKAALRAIKYLYHPFAEFKWVDGSVSHAALMAALFTTGVRHLFSEGVPLFAVDAPRFGSGKTKLVKAISILWYGRSMATTPYSSDHEEMKKHLSAMLLSGDRVVLFDNVHPRVLVNDPTLNQLLTNGRVTFRELATHRMLDLESSATFFMTGNHLKIIGDMIRRTIKMTIDPGGLNPMNRVFKIDPLEAYISEHRVELLSAALTCLVAYFNAGCPAPKNNPGIASFEKWSDIIRNLLLWLDLDDVKECISSGYEQDDESTEIEHLLEMLFVIPELHGDGLSSAMLLPMMEANKTLKEAMLPFINERSSTGVSHPRVVTTVLSQVAKIPVKGQRLLKLGPVWVVRGDEEEAKA